MAASIATPATAGDQLLFPYDARPGRTSYFSVLNPSRERILVDVAVYATSLQQRVAEVVRAIEPRGQIIVDPQAIGGGSVLGNAGLVVVTPVRAADQPLPVVPPAPLVGAFTIANTALRAAFGENALARLAREEDGRHAAPGQIVDGREVVYQTIAPRRLSLPTYFDPRDLAPAEVDGNRLLLAAFRDRYGARFDIVPLAMTIAIDAFDGDGHSVEIPAELRLRTISGVVITSLQEISGGAIGSSSGKLFILADPGRGNLLGMFSQSIGTYASGQRLPGDGGDAAP